MMKRPNQLDVTKADLERLGRYTRFDEDRFQITIRGPLADQAAALQRIKGLLGEMPHLDIVVALHPL